MIYGNVWALTMGLLIPNEIALWFANVEYEIREVEDSRYGSVKAYHTDVIEAFRHALKTDRNILWKYRRRVGIAGQGKTALLVDETNRAFILIQ